jgi:hypothetical protein
VNWNREVDKVVHVNSEMAYITELMGKLKVGDIPSIKSCLDLQNFTQVRREIWHLIPPSVKEISLGGELIYRRPHPRNNISDSTPWDESDISKFCRNLLKSPKPL